MVAAGLLAFVAVMVVLRDRETVVQIPMVVSDVAAGDRVDLDDVTLVTARGPSTALSDAAITSDDFSAAAEEGLVAVRHIPAGSLLSAVDLAPPLATSIARTMSLPVATTDGVARSLVRGDVVDIVAVVDGVASFFAHNVVVVESAPSAQPASGPPSVTIEVDATTSLRLAWALTRAELRFVRATGAPASDPASVYPAPTPATEVSAVGD
jgi:hypothetical protein